MARANPRRSIEIRPMLRLRFKTVDFSVALPTLTLIVLAMLAGCAPEPAPQTAALRGTASLNQAADLPEGSQLLVTLEDLSQANTASTLLTELQQSAVQPMNFLLYYQPSVLIPGHRYNVRARIEDVDGTLLWSTNTHHPLPSENKPVHLQLVAPNARIKTAYTLFFVCEQEGLLVQTRGDVTTLTLQQQSYPVTVATHSAGAHYVSDQIDFQTSGHSATLTLANQPTRMCSEQPPMRPWAEAALRGIDYRATGNEPSWLLELDSDATIALTLDYGATQHTLPAPEPSFPEAGHTRYVTHAESGSLTLDIIDRDCTDTMSHQHFPQTVSVRWNKRDYQGCGMHLSWPLQNVQPFLAQPAVE